MYCLSMYIYGQYGHGVFWMSELEIGGDVKTLSELADEIGSVKH